MATSVSVPVGVTLGDSYVVFNFNGDYTTGQFANGDWWVVGGAGRTITSITPACNTNYSGTWSNAVAYTGTVINGATINAGCNTDAIGTISAATDAHATVLFGRRLSPYDSRVYPGGQGNNCPYDARLNVDPGATGSPISMVIPISITKAVGFLTPNKNNVVISDYVVLTVVASAPAAGSFRPATSTANKTILYNTSQIDFTILPSLDQTLITTRPTLAQALAPVQRWFQLGYLDLLTGENMYSYNSLGPAVYGREYAAAFDQAYLTLMMNYTQTQLMPIYIGILQFGIDILGRILEGGVVPDTGGGNMNWKFPVILCALNFKTANSISVCDASQGLLFAEDRMVFPVTQLHTTVKPPYLAQYGINNGALGYLVGDVITDNNTNFDGTTRGSATITNICTNGQIGNPPLNGAAETPGTGGMYQNAGADYNTEPQGSVPYSGGSGSGLQVRLPRLFDKYTPDLIGTPDWSSSHTWSGGTPTNALGVEGANWNLNYRDICGYGFLGGTVATRLVTGGLAAWNNPLFFEYMDRLWNMEGAPDFAALQALGFAYPINSGSPLQRQAWTLWRGSLAGSVANLIETAAIGNACWFRFDYCLSRRSPPATSAFTIYETVNNVQNTHTITSVSIYGRAVRILTSTPFTNGSLVQINYTQPAANPIKDLRGNLIPSITQYVIAIGTRGDQLAYRRGW